MKGIPLSDKEYAETKAELLDKITALTEENRRLQESRDNTVKMLKVVLGMLDRISHL